MITFLIRAAIFLFSAALGLIVADLILPGFHIDWTDWWGFVLAVVIFAVIQSVLAPWVFKLTRRHAAPLLGGIGIISTFIAILIVVLIPNAGIGISDPLAWVLGAGDRVDHHGARDVAAADGLPQERGRAAPRRLSRRVRCCSRARSAARGCRAPRAWRAASPERRPGCCRPARRASPRRSRR